jgi:DNA-directed RNA polymerase specialized sigma24 family protein
VSVNDQASPYAAGSRPGTGGSSSAELDRFYKTLFLPLVRRAVRKHGVSFEDGADIVQDAFVLAIGKLDASKNPKAWLYQVVDHLSVNFRRKVVRRARLTAQWISSSPPPNDLSDD